MRSEDRRRASFTGFTLLELIVVVAIAGVLMALLLPALSTAKETSRRSVCNQNIRQDILALLLYADYDYDKGGQGLLPSAVGNKGDYHSIVLSDATFTSLVSIMGGESNTLYCPNLVHATGTMGGYDPNFGYTIGYSYLAAAPLPPTPKGPDEGWIGPQKSSDTGEVLADANYWTATPSQAMTVAPHTPGGGTVIPFFAAAASSATQSASTSPVPGATSGAIGAVGGNVGSMDGHVIWQPIRSLKQYPASTDGAFGNW